MSPVSISEATNGSHRGAAQDFPDGCTCVCHRPSSNICPIPSWLNPWLGRLSIPRTFVTTLFPSISPCDNVECTENWRKPEVQTIFYYPPIWFAQVEASIRFEAFPLYFCIQTPRVVSPGSLLSLAYISFDEFRHMLSTREITLHDVTPDGFSVLHVSLGLSQCNMPQDDYPCAAASSKRAAARRCIRSDRICRGSWDSAGLAV